MCRSPTSFFQNTDKSELSTGSNPRTEAELLTELNSFSKESQSSYFEF